jgi:hypothetical protein
MSTDRPTSAQRALRLQWLGAGSALAMAVALAAPPCAAQSMPVVPLAGQSVAPTRTVRLPLGERTNLVVEQRTWQPPAQLTDLVNPPPRAALALEFRSPSRGDVARSLLQVKLSGDSVLNFRPRGGGLTVTYKAKF